MLSKFRGRIIGLRAQIAAARKTGHEMLTLHGDGVWIKFADLQESAWKRSAYKEFMFWKLAAEYGRELQKSDRRKSPEV
jgi:hypothetical protein